MSRSQGNGQESDMKLRRGPWTVEEDLKLINYIAIHGEGRWNSLARLAGLNRTGKSCRLRWLNYLRPDVRRGNITPEEQLLILDLHSRFGNRWSKIAQYLPGRTDNEIKNYWRTRVQKHANQLRCDVNSKQFKDTMKYLWMPRLVERIQAASAAATTTSSAPTEGCISSPDHLNNKFRNTDWYSHSEQSIITPDALQNYYYCSAEYNTGFEATENCSDNNDNCEPESSDVAATSSDSVRMEVSPASDLSTDYCNVPATSGNPNPTLDGYIPGPGNNCEQSLVMLSGIDYPKIGLDYPAVGQNNPWLGGVDPLESLWNNVDDFWFLQEQFNNNCNYM